MQWATKQSLSPWIYIYGLALYSLNVSAVSLSDPFYSTNRNPFVQIYGLPAAQTAVVTSPSAYIVDLQLEAANNFTFSNKGNEAIFIDGETHRANLNVRYGLAENMNIAIDIPYVSHEGGRLDGFIDSWHDTFGFSDGGRPDFAEDQLLFQYSKNGVTEVLVNEPGGGIGDVSVSMAYQLQDMQEKNVAVRAGIKLPTGDAGSLLGSESTDIFAGIYLSDVAASKWHWHANAGMLWMSGGEVIDDDRNDFVVYGSGTLSYLWSEEINVKVQLDAHSAFYNNETKELGSASAQLILGGSLRLSKSMLLDISVSEDVVVDTAPDVVFQLGLRKSW